MVLGYHRMISTKGSGNYRWSVMAMDASKAVVMDVFILVVVVPHLAYVAVMEDASSTVLMPCIIVLMPSSMVLTPSNIVLMPSSIHSADALHYSADAL